MICIVLGVESNEKSVLSLILNSISAPFSIHSLDAQTQCRGAVPDPPLRALLAALLSHFLHPQMRVFNSCPRGEKKGSLCVCHRQAGSRQGEV